MLDDEPLALTPHRLAHTTQPYSGDRRNFGVCAKQSCAAI